MITRSAPFREQEKEWDEAAIGSGACFLQSAEWGELQKKLGKDVRMLQAGGVSGLVVMNPLPLGFSYLYVPRGPFGDVENAGALRAFVDAARKEAGPKTLFLRVEPFVSDSAEERGVLRAAGFAVGPSVQPKETRVIDLAKDEGELLKDMEHDTRYAIRAAARRGVSVRRVTDPSLKEKTFADFWELFSATNDRHELKAFPRRYYELVAGIDGRCSSSLFFADLAGKPIAAAIIVRFGAFAVYLYAASGAGFGRYNAPSLILWEALRAAKREGAKTFDLWGISHTNRKWAGVTSFKKSFGGEELSLVGTWDMPLQTFFYRGYRVFAKMK